MFSALVEELESFKKKEDRQLLRDFYSVFTRESISIEYLTLQLTKVSIPSILFRIQNLDMSIMEFLDSDPEDLDFLGFQEAVYCMEEALDVFLKKEKLNYTPIQKRNLAIQLYQYRSANLMKGVGFPSGFRYLSVLKKFSSLTKNKLDSPSFLQKYRNKILSGAALEKKFGKKILIYGYNPVEPLVYEILKNVSGNLDILWFSVLPPVELLRSKEDESVHLSSNHIRSLSKTQSPFPETSAYPPVRLHKSLEIYREIDYVGRNILSKFKAGKDNDDFHLTRIKVILPDSPEYRVAFYNVFRTLKIPFTFTNESFSLRITSYYNAFQKILSLTESDYHPEEVFLLFHNPCFYPEINGERISFSSSEFYQIYSRFRVSGYLDRKDRDLRGVRIDSKYTWDDFWKKLNLSILGEDESIYFNEDQKLEAENLLLVSTSLLQDLIYLKEKKFWKPAEYASFLRIILDVYLSVKPRPEIFEEGEIDQEISGNLEMERRIRGILQEIEDFGEFLKSINSSREYTKDELNQIIEEGLSSGKRYSQKLLKFGVVVGDFSDTHIPGFDFIYILGLNDRLLPAAYRENPELDGKSDAIQKIADTERASIENFFHTFCQVNQELHLSYVSRDMIKDREIYPSTYLTKVKDLLNLKYNEIPLYIHNEFRKGIDQAYEPISRSLLKMKHAERKSSDLPFLLPSWKKTDEIPEFPIGLQGKNLDKLFFRPGFKEEIPDVEIPKDVFYPRSIAKYLECPKKFYFERYIGEDDVEDYSSTIDSIDSLEYHNLVVEFFKIISDPSISWEETQKKISEYIESSNSYPEGILLSNYLKQLFANLKSSFEHFQKELAGRSKFLIQPYFSREENKNRKSQYFPSFEWEGRSVEYNPDVLFLKDSVLYLGLIQTATTVGEKHKIRRFVLSHFASILKDSEETKDSIAKHFGESFGSISLIVFERGKDSVFGLKEAKGKLDSPEEFSEILKIFLNEYDSKKFPASPVGKKTCKYCRFQSVCPGVSIEYEEWMEEDRLNLLDRVNQIFPANKTKS